MGILSGILGAVGPQLLQGGLGLLGLGGNSGGQGQAQSNSIEQMLQNVFSQTQGQTSQQNNGQQFGQQLQGPGQFTSGYFQNGLDFLGNAFNNAPNTSYQGPINANINATQIAGNNASTNLGSAYLGQGEQTRQLANQTLRGDFLNPQSNPYLSNVISQTAMPSIRAFQEEFLPQSNSSAIAQGAFGGSRNGITNALGIDRFTENLTDTIGSQLFNNYSNERDRQFQAPQLLQSAFGIEQAAANTLRDAGQEQRGFEQSQIDEFRTLDDLARTQQFDLVDRLFGSLGQVGDRSTTNSGFSTDISNSRNISSTNQTTNRTASNAGTSTEAPGVTAARNANTQGQSIRNSSNQNILNSMPFQTQVQLQNFAKQMFPNATPQDAMNQFLQRMQGTPIPFNAFQGVTN